MEQAAPSLSIEEQKARFRQTAITHRLLEQTARAIVRAIQEPAGFALVLVYGPKGVGKTKMLSVIADRIDGRECFIFWWAPMIY